MVTDHVPSASALPSTLTRGSSCSATSILAKPPRTFGAVAAPVVTPTPVMVTVRPATSSGTSETLKPGKYQEPSSRRVQ